MDVVSGPAACKAGYKINFLTLPNNMSGCAGMGNASNLELLQHVLIWVRSMAGSTCQSQKDQGTADGQQSCCQSWLASTVSLSVGSRDGTRQIGNKSIAITDTTALLWGIHGGYQAIKL